MEVEVFDSTTDSQIIEACTDEADTPCQTAAYTGTYIKFDLGSDHEVDDVIGVLFAFEIDKVWAVKPLNVQNSKISRQSTLAESVWDSK